MATIRLIPSTYYLSNTQYLSVSDANNMYANTDSTTYATVTNSRNQTTSYYIYIRGFNFSDVPSNAIVNFITIKLKAYHSGGNTSTIYCYDGTTQVTAAGSTTALGTSATVKTFTNTTVDWDTLKNYGSDFGIRINCRRSSRNTTSYVYIYGAEILVDYTIPVYHNISVTNNSVVASVSPTGQQSILEGSDFTVTIADIDDKSKISVTDNNVDVTSQLVEAPSIINRVFNPATFVSSSTTVTNQNNALADTDSTTYARMPIGQQEKNYMIYAFDISSIPSNAMINSVSCVVKASTATSSNITTKDVQLYSGTTPKGSVGTIPTTTGGTVTLSPGTWTRQELENIRIRFDGYYGGTYSNYNIDFYGADLTINYTTDGVVYTYTISNIVADHNIVINDVALQQSVYRKVNNAWSKYSKIYIKQNNVWVEQSDFEAVFQSNKIYVNK